MPGLCILMTRLTKPTGSTLGTKGFAKVSFQNGNVPSGHIPLEWLVSSHIWVMNFMIKRLANIHFSFGFTVIKKTKVWMLTLPQTLAFITFHLNSVHGFFQNHVYWHKINVFDEILFEMGRMLMQVEKLLVQQHFPLRPFIAVNTCVSNGFFFIIITAYITCNISSLFVCTLTTYISSPLHFFEQCHQNNYNDPVKAASGCISI